jgi:hypothetical protein
MRISGVSLVKDAVRLDFPLLESLRSILPLCDELIVNVGPSADGTRALVERLADPRLRIIEGEWRAGPGGAVLARETQRALAAATGDWAIYIQADEVLHEDGIAPLRQALAAADPDSDVEGLLVDFLHFYGSSDWIGGGRAWYRREVRAIRLGADVRSHADAQGFRVGPEGRKIRARRSGATWYHYGWARPLPALSAKREADHQLLYGGRERRGPLDGQLPWDVGLAPFRGRHPAVMAGWIAARRQAMADSFAPRRWDGRRLALLASLGIEQLTGWRPFEYRNYVEV